MSETKNLNEDNNWKENFSAVEGGADNTYRVVGNYTSQGL